MDKPAKTTTQKKRGRKSGEEILQQVAAALKNIQELELLEESPLGRLPAVRHLAEGKYNQAIFPVGFSLRSLLLEAEKRVVEDLKDIPTYQRELEFLHKLVQGQSVACISRDLGLSREHVARTIRPRAINLVARVFLPRVNQSSVDAPPDCPGHSMT